MSLVLKTIQAFPRGRSTDDLLVLVGAGFSHDKRVAALAELTELHNEGLALKGRDGLWRPQKAYSVEPGIDGPGQLKRPNSLESETLIAAPAAFGVEKLPLATENEDENDPGVVDPQALLRYLRSALRADPRGATTQVADKHAFEWALISGPGPMVPRVDERLVISIRLEALNPTFREALVRREGNENALAIGWPMSVSRRGSAPVFHPVGLLAAAWKRTEESLLLTVGADDVLVNPDWIKGAAKNSNWNRSALGDLFDAADGAGLPSAEFLARLRDAVASQIRGGIVGRDLASQLDMNSQGIFDAAAVFLPTDSSFTAGAARDLDKIATWPNERLARTALAPILQLEAAVERRTSSVINVGPTNGEQLEAIRYGCETPLTVVTGPPGTGKSQAIVSMAASVLLSGGSVLVASKNHQALDAVESRLGGLAPKTPFFVRTLNPEAELDVGFADVLKELIEKSKNVRFTDVDPAMSEELDHKALRRIQNTDVLAKRNQLECRIADTLERITFHEERVSNAPEERSSEQVRSQRSRSLLDTLIGLLKKWLGKAPLSMGADEAQTIFSLPELRELLVMLRTERDGLFAPEELVELSEAIQDLAQKVLPKYLALRTHISEERRQDIANAHGEWEFAGGRGHLPTDLARVVVEHRPLWLASILGTPRRIPLDDELFDLVIFDEASQCDVATAIPLFARAKRAVVVGDAQQLSFIPQLGLAQDRNLVLAQGLPLSRMGRFSQSRRSLFDFASRVPGSSHVTLRHQYRSAGPIVDYISSTFYGNQLQTSYDPTRMVVPTGSKPGLAWEHVPSPTIPQNGNVNSNEVTAIVAHLRKLLTEQDYEGSIGIITPFRAQVLALQEAISATFSQASLQASALKIATVDSFQGQERDLVLFSPCVGSHSPSSGLTFFSRDTRRLNVAISRARAVAITFGDLNFARSGCSSALERLADRSTNPRQRVGEGVFDSEWERQLFHALKTRGLDPKPQHEIAGRWLDFALFGASGVKLDLEVDGRRWHQSIDGKRKTSDLWRDHQLKSLGWRVRRFWVDELAKDMEACLDIIERDLS